MASPASRRTRVRDLRDVSNLFQRRRDECAEALPRWLAKQAQTGRKGDRTLQHGIIRREARDDGIEIVIKSEIPSRQFLRTPRDFDVIRARLPEEERRAIDQTDESTCDLLPVKHLSGTERRREIEPPNRNLDQAALEMLLEGIWKAKDHGISAGHARAPQKSQSQRIK